MIGKSVIKRVISTLTAGAAALCMGFVSMGGGVSAAERSVYSTELMSYGSSRMADAHTPIGYLDAVSGGKGTITVRGWAFDWDNTSQPLTIHIYVGGPAGSGNKNIYVLTADKSRPDVNNVHKGSGNNHGFEGTIKVTPRGTQTVYVYAINVGAGDVNPLIGKGSVTITEGSTPTPTPSGTETATIRMLWSKNKTYTSGYYVSTWSTSNANVVRVNMTGDRKCKLVAKSAGTATVRGYDSSQKEVVNLSIYIDDPEITNDEVIRFRGTQRINVSGLNYAQVVGYKSSKPGVISVDSNGTMRSRKNGRAKITVKTTAGNISKYFRVRA